MAATDVAVAMGPRNRRRLTTGAVIVGAIGVVAAALAVWGLHNHSGAATSAGRATSASGPWTAHHLVFGMTAERVRRVVGAQPAAIQGACWVYRPTVGTYNGLPARRVGSLWVGQPGSDAARSADGIKLCFYGGVLNEEYLHAHTLLGWEWIPALF